MNSTKPVIEKLLGRPASPCISICEMNAQTGWCVGCFRTLDEIAIWGSAPDAQLRAILAQLPDRQSQSFAA
jgi:predicted Fe-S protein YdhL (DUF1289 family)